MFITFEGGEGTGKSTQVRLLAQRLRDHGHNVLVTREPGGTLQGEQLRNLLVTGDANKWLPNEDVLLNYAARSVHIRSVIAPALLSKQIVICDRFIDSTWVYQGYASGASQPLIEFLMRSVVADVDAIPDLTFVLDIDPTIGILRSRSRMAEQKIAAELLLNQASNSSNLVQADRNAAAGLTAASGEDRFEKMNIDFHQRVREGFRVVAETNPKRCKFIDSSQPVNDIHTKIWAMWVEING